VARLCCPPFNPSFYHRRLCARLCLFEFCHLAATLNDASASFAAKLTTSFRAQDQTHARICLALLSPPLVATTHSHPSETTQPAPPPHSIRAQREPQAQTVINDDSIAIVAIVTVLIPLRVAQKPGWDHRPGPVNIFRSKWSTSDG